MPDALPRLVHSESPPNHEPRADLLTASFVTPEKHFYVRSHAPTPDVDPATFTLVVDGLVDRPLRLSLADLDRFERVEETALMCCAGNRRRELHALAPTPGETPWHSGALGTAVWGGVRLADVLAEAGVQGGARHVAFEGLDRVEKYGRTFGYGGSIPLDKALAPEVLLADTMNGGPLATDHGAPLRVVVPGVIGARSVKWVAHVTVQAEESDNYYQQHAYKLFPPETEPETADWCAQPAIQDLPLNAVLTETTGLVAPGTTTLQGYAYTGGGHTIERVEVSTDGGSTWTQADLGDEGSRWTWRLWSLDVDLAPGAYEIVVRASDGEREQPTSVTETWNFKGYLHNAWHRTLLRVPEVG